MTNHEFPTEPGGPQDPEIYLTPEKMRQIFNGHRDLRYQLLLEAVNPDSETGENYTIDEILASEAENRRQLRMISEAEDNPMLPEEFDTIEQEEEARETAQQEYEQAQHDQAAAFALDDIDVLLIATLPETSNRHRVRNVFYDENAPLVRMTLQGPATMRDGRYTVPHVIVESDGSSVTLRKEYDYFSSGQRQVTGDVKPVDRSEAAEALRLIEEQNNGPLPLELLSYIED